MSSETELAALVDRIRTCRLCVDRPAGKPLSHEPRPVLVPSRTARVLIAGQAPGTKVHATGISFNDASGNRLRDWLGVTREQFYDPDNFALAAMGFCFPGQDARGADLPPRRECAPTWRTPLMALMPQIEIVLAIGLHAQRWHLGARRGPSLVETVGRWREQLGANEGPVVLALPHPSWRNNGWLRKNSWFETDLLPRLRLEIARRIRR